MKLQSFVLGSLARCVRTSAVLLTLGTALLGQERFRLGDPQALSASGSGSSVDPRTGGLTMVMPVGQVGGELPIPVALRVNGQFKIQSASRQTFEPGDPTEPPPLNKPHWYNTGTVDVIRPVYGTVHLGYIVPCSQYDGPVNTEFVVLEDGTQFRTADFASFTSWNSTFTLPQDFGFLAKAPSQVQVTNLGSHALYPATSAELGSTWQTKVQGLVPTGFGTIEDAYRVLMDKDRARVFVKLTDLNMWVPVLWVDRFNHWVGMKWQRYTTGLPAGITATYSVEVRNQRDQGVMLTWADFSAKDAVQDLLRADFIGVNAPCILVRGYPGVALARPEGTSGSNSMMLATVKVAGPVGRPTSVQIGESLEVPYCSWSASAPPVSSGGLKMMKPKGTIPLRMWYFDYDANQAALRSMTDSMGVRTTYTYETMNIPTTQTLIYADSVGGERNRYTLGGLTIWSVNKTLAYDGVTAKTLSRTWTRGTATTGEPNVLFKETFGDLDACPRWTELLYAKSTDANGRDYGNGALKELRLWESGKTEPTASAIYTLQGAGLDYSYSYASGMVVKRSGEPTRTVANQLGSNLVETIKETQFVGSPASKVQETSTTYQRKKDKLDIRRPILTAVTRWGTATGSGAIIVTTKTEYDAKGLPSKAYRQGSTDQQGSSFTYDDDGRLILQKPIPEGTSPTTQSYGYDPATGQLATQTTSYLPDGGSSMTDLSRTLSDFDSAGRPQTITDERGLVIRQAFDGLGRVVEAQSPVGPSTTISYPTATRRVVTKGSVSVTEDTDGFGRIIKQTRADGSWEETTYDDFGRVETTRRYSRLGAPQSPATTLYDALDRPTAITSPGGAYQTVTYSVDPAYPTWSLTTRTLNTPKILATTKEYRDGLGQVVRQESPKGDVTESTYDGAGNLKKVVLTPAGNGTPQVREFVYDEWGRMTQRTEPETGTTLFKEFNWAGKPTRIEEAEGRVRTLAYDGLGRLVRMESGKEKITYTFSGADLTNMSSLSDGVEVKQRFEFNGPGKQLSLEETIQPGMTSQIGYGYDPSTGLLKTLTYPNGRNVEYGRDGLGRITGILNNGSSLVSSVSFDEWGNRQRLGFASGAYSDWSSKDGGTHLDQWNIGYNNSLLDGTRFYQYDSAERLTMAGDWDKLEHDEQGRLVTANSSSLGINTTHGHDAYGNNISHLGTGNVPNGTMNNFAFNPLPSNRLPGLASNGALTGWSVNGRGEATQIGTGMATNQYLGLGWDGFGRLKAVSYPSGTQSYVYAPSGMRVALIDTATANNRRYAYTSSGILLSEYGEAVAASPLRTLAASSTATPSKTTSKTKKTAQGLAYMLPIDEPMEEAGAWIDQPSGPTTVMVGQSISFQGSTDFGTSFRWTFGDGTIATTATATKAFNTVGTYNVVFRASRTGFVASTASVQITVVPAGPMIRSFTANPSTIGEGSSTTLSWDVSGATSISISGLGNVAATGSSPVGPRITTTYTLTATGSGKNVTSSVVINVVPAPVILFFNATPISQPGQVSTLRWLVDNATSYELDQGIGPVNGTWAQIWPGKTMTFRLTAINQVNGIKVSRTASTTVTVGAASNAIWRRDVIYLGSEPVAEIDADGVHELHNDHLGSPLIVTKGSTAQIEGRQVFGPYGELVKSEGYIPLTGYTGHIKQDATGLIYMRGRFYSPAWHRFLNSDQGVDPSSWNQMAYVGGSPFHAIDPSGMSTLTVHCSDGRVLQKEVSADLSPEEVMNIGNEMCSGGGGGGGGSSSGSGSGNSNPWGPWGPWGPPGGNGNGTPGGSPSGGGGTGGGASNGVPGTPPAVPQTPKRSYTDCLLAEAAKQGLGKDLLMLALNGASTFFDPTGISGMALGAYQLSEASSSFSENPLGTTSGASALGLGVAKFTNDTTRGVGVVAGTMMNRGFKVSLGSSFWRGVPGLNKALGAISLGVDVIRAGAKIAGIVSTCNKE